MQEESKWIAGTGWMRQDISKAVSDGVLKPVKDLRLNTKKILTLTMMVVSLIRFLRF